MLLFDIGTMFSLAGAILVIVGFLLVSFGSSKHRYKRIIITERIINFVLVISVVTLLAGIIIMLSQL